jgi:hypothetical protein
MVWIFARMSRTHRTLGSHQICVFHRCLEQLAGQEARREHKEASAHALEAGAPPEAVLTITKHRLNRATITRSPSTVSFTISLQNEFLMPFGSRRKNQIEV